MKSRIICALSLALLLSLHAFAQGTFIYDQQSSDESRYLEGGVALGQQPLGQTFAPTLESVGFIRLYIYSSGLGPGTILLNLRSGSITGNTERSTTPVTLNSGFSGPVDFFFPSPTPVIPNATYVFQPVVQSGGGWGARIGAYNYLGGTAIINGSASPSVDFWFREGLYIPEPSATALALLGVATLGWVRRRQFPAQ
jgi:hypothetical protein